MQIYVEARPNAKLSVTGQQTLKRKSPGDDTPISRDQSGILTPQASTHVKSRTASVVSISSEEDDEDDDVTVYNAVLERKNGWISATQVSK